MAVQNIALSWGTYLDQTAQTTQRGGDSSMRVGYYNITPGYQYRPVIALANDQFSGRIVSITLNLYCSATGAENFAIHTVNRTTTSAATWQHSGNSAWQNNGCDATEEDRTAAVWASDYKFTSTGWHAISITNLTPFNSFFSGQRVLILRPTEVNQNYAVIEKSPAPYLSITYTTSLLGGVQIF